MIVAFAAGCASAQTSVPKEPAWKATVTVLDEANHALADAKVEVSYYVIPPPGQREASDKVAGVTDANGVFTISHENTGSIGLGFLATKDRYYSASASHQFADFNQQDPAKWNPSVTLLLKKIGKPIPMYAKALMQPPPDKDKGVGYDLEVGDWIAPYGKGKSTDIIFTSHFDKRANNDWDYSLTVTFPKQGDGIQPFSISDLEKTSSLRSPHDAPENGYRPEWIKTQSQRPGQGSVDGIDKSLSFFFRVRTVLNEKGDVVSANYGKIYGDFMNLYYFLNPAPNSRNIEFDPTKNLLKKLGPSEGVSFP